MKDSLSRSRIVLLGLGRVGLSFLDLLAHREAQINRRLSIAAVADSRGVLFSGERLDPAHLAESKRSGRIHSFSGWVQGEDLEYALHHVDADILIDCSTSNFRDAQPSLRTMLLALRLGMDAVTANKGPPALRLRELVAEASSHGARLKYGATVGGGTPFIDYGLLCASRGEIAHLKGVLNGTTNYLLTGMEMGLSQSEALEEAKSLGIAETDPSDDINGMDSAAKIVILANALCGTFFSISDVRREGIGSVTAEMMTNASSGKKHVKLTCSFDAASGTLSVGPEAIELNDPLAVPGVYNAVTYHGAGEFSLVGTGAGAAGTARAVFRDLIALTEDG